ncbi:MAG: diguanylate cyclase [Butyrivibrio sp.]|nr:diguanylate cyclase [Butyrivibrio sp.]
MKQYNYELTCPQDAGKALEEVYAYTQGQQYKSILFHLFTIKFDSEKINEVQKMILDVFPDAYIAGTSSNGDICDGHLAEYGMVMSASVFDSTDIDVSLLECEPGNEPEIGRKICEIIDSSENIKAAEILITLKSINSNDILREAEKCRKDVKIFGGGSAGFNIDMTDTRVVAGDKLSDKGVALVTYSGNDFYIDIHHAIGWKALGKDLTVTKIEDKRLYELDNIPAGQIYSKYLDIQPDENFFKNMLEFPLMSRQHGYEVLRLPFSCRMEDNSILLAAAVKKGSTVNLSYGDPDVIRTDVNALVEKTKNFAPQAIFLYSCGVRRLYWKYLINKETGPFSLIAPVSGFYSSGEIMRMDDYIIEHHVTLIAIGMREGGEAEAQPTGIGDKAIAMTEEQKMHGQLSMVRRLANFINVTSKELIQANEELQRMADTDALTGMYNRRMLDKLIRTGLDHVKKFDVKVVIGIIDIDDFKEVNDTYGHAMGDEVLRVVTRIIQNEIDKIDGAICGRYGGEEFLFLIPNLSLDEAIEKVEKIRAEVEETSFEDVGHKTISIGMSQYHKGDNIEQFFEHADSALYEAKGSGKNKICVCK